MLATYNARATIILIPTLLALGLACRNPSTQNDPVPDSVEKSDPFGSSAPSISPELAALFARQERLMPIVDQLVISHHGNVPQDEIYAAFTPEDVDAILKLLEDRAVRPYWSDVVTIARYLRPEELVVPALIQYIHEPDHFESTEYGKFYSKAEALRSLGYFDSREGWELMRTALTEDGANALIKTWTDQDVMQLFRLRGTSYAWLVMAEAAFGLVETRDSTYVVHVESLYRELLPHVKEISRLDHPTEDELNIQFLFNNVVQALVFRDIYDRIDAGEDPKNLDSYQEERFRFYNEGIFD